MEDEAVTDGKHIGGGIGLLPGNGDAGLQSEVLIDLDQLVIDMAHHGLGVDLVGNAGVQVVAHSGQSHSDGGGAGGSGAVCGRGLSALAAACEQGHDQNESQYDRYCTFHFCFLLSKCI